MVTMFAVAGAGVALAVTGPEIGDVRLRGVIGERMDRCIANSVARVNPDYLTACFTNRTETKLWQTEFWGKWMHSAVPFWTYTGDAALKAKIDAGVKAVLAAQLPDGYIGNYLEKDRCRHDWDVWGMKYTMLGLLHYYDGTGDGAALAAARRVCDYLMTQFPAKLPLRKSSEWNGLASCSVIEPVVWLYRRTGERKYLDFAEYALSELEEPADSCRILSEAEKDVPVADRAPWTTNCIYGVNIAIKAYEDMSCFQGILELYEATGDGRLLACAKATAANIVRTELNIAGGASSMERWYHGAERQTRDFISLQETCVQTTWMRLCQKLLALTGEVRWADELERTFYNAYLGALSADDSTFTQYTPLQGWRARGVDHCRMTTNCCNANGPRGFLAFLGSLLQAEGDSVTLNLYADSTAAVRVPAFGGKVALETRTRYPYDGEVEIRVRSAGERPFALRLRKPSWCGKMSVKVNGAPVETATRDGYVTIRRGWRADDAVSICFDMPCKAHVRDGHVAFTRGPLVLARDRRFGDGELADVVRGLDRSNPSRGLVCRSVAPRVPGLASAFAIDLKLGPHTVDASHVSASPILFTDFASAGETWTPDSAYRVWLSLEQVPYGR